MCSSRTAAGNIKVLKDLDNIAAPRAIDIKVLKDLTPFIPRIVARGPSPVSTRACERVSPPRSRVPEGLARDRPSPYGR